jgi:DNA helicase HerA-like ATPase
MRSKNLKIELPSSVRYKYETPEMMPNLATQLLCCGAKGSGKTIAIVNLVKKLEFDRVFLISPTAKSNHAILSMININPEDMYEDTEDLTIIDDIISKVEQEGIEYDEYHEKMKEYNEFIKKINNNEFNLISDNDLETFMNDSNEIVKPEHYLNGRRPKIALVADDILGSFLMSKGIRKVNNLAIKHRHISPVNAEGGGAIGISTFFLTQTFRCQTGGISKPIRSNCNSLIIFKTKNENEYNDLAEEVAGEIGKELFNKIYTMATDEPHGFLFIDFNPKPQHPSRFRKNLDTFLIANTDGSITQRRYE